MEVFTVTPLLTRLGAVVTAVAAYEDRLYVSCDDGSLRLAKAIGVFRSLSRKAAGYKVVSRTHLLY